MNLALFCYSPASINIMKVLFVNTPDFVENLYVYIYNDAVSKVFFKDLDLQSLNCNIHFLHHDIDTSLNNVDILVYGTGSVGPIETTLPSRAKFFNPDIKTVAVHDIFWSTPENFRLRYSDDTPDFIIVNSLSEKELLTKELTLIKESEVLVFGNPHFSRLLSYKAKQLPLKNSVSFISQCGIGASYNEPTSECSKSAIKALIELKNEGIISSLKIYKHPRENTSFYEDSNINFSKTNEFADMMSNDIIISCGSTPQYEAILLGKKTIFAKDKETMKSKILSENFDSYDTHINPNSISDFFNFIHSLKNKK